MPHDHRERIQERFDFIIEGLEETINGLLSHEVRVSSLLNTSLENLTDASAAWGCYLAAENNPTREFFFKEILLQVTRGLVRIRMASERVFDGHPLEAQIDRLFEEGVSPLMENLDRVKKEDFPC